MKHLPFRLALAAIAGLAGLSAASPALARVSFVAASPAQGASAQNVTRVTVTFSEPVAAQKSGLEVVMTAMPGMTAHHAMKITGLKVAVSPDGKSLTATSARPLPMGSYDVNWRAAGQDGAVVAGKVSFTVR